MTLARHEKPATAQAVEPLLVARDVHLAFGTTQALRGVTVELAPGEVLALRGPSGSGKSTLLHCLAGILRPDSGEIVYRGQRLDSESDERRSALRRSDFGFVFQFGSLVSELTALENVALPLRLSGLRRRPAEASAREWLDRFDVGEVAGKRAGEMSGGQGQRVAVARALVSGPRVIFADEPTGALDPHTATGMLRLLRAVPDGTTVVIVTHDPQVTRFSDRAVFLHAGRVDRELYRPEPGAVAHVLYPAAGLIAAIAILTVAAVMIPFGLMLRREPALSPG
jgi:putative ABC transport system ATP-binding protein